MFIEDRNVINIHTPILVFVVEVIRAVKNELLFAIFAQNHDANNLTPKFQDIIKCCVITISNKEFL